MVELILPMLLFATIAGVTPGPNNIMIMASGLNFGIARSVPHLLGICLGFPTMVIVIGMGLGFVFATYPLLHSIIKVCGMLYIIYLAWRIAHSGGGLGSGEVGHPLSFLQAALFQWVNPKAWVMASSAISTYTTIASAILPQVLFIALIFFLVTFPVVMLWLVFGVGLRRFLEHPTKRKRFNICMAWLLVLSMIPALQRFIQQTQYW